METGRKKIVAPTDPKFKGKYFYLYKDLKFEAFLRPSGRRTCENYLDDGRIQSAIKINGGITDDKILSMFDTAKGSQELIKGIGIEITSEKSDAGFDVRVIYYGKTDRNETGTHIYRRIISNGVEEYIDFSEVEFSDYDRILGQLEIEFPDDLSVAVMTVKIYVDEKYDIREQVEDEQVDITSDAYAEMIKSSLCAAGNNERFMNAVNKAKAGENVTVAFIGGSITQGAGAVPQASECYAYKAYLGFKQLIEKETGKDAQNVHYIRAGIGGTPSELGVVRYDKDVRYFGEVEPDIVVIEFAVNDDGDETEGDCYEGLMRKIWFGISKPAVILLYSIFADDFNLQDRFIPIGEKYGVPMVSVKNAVMTQFKKSDDCISRVISKRQYFYDFYHPSNIGHTIMADCLINYFKEAAKKPVTQDIENPPVVRSDEFDDLVYFDRKYEPTENYVNQLSAANDVNYVNQTPTVDNVYLNYVNQSAASCKTVSITPGSFTDTDKQLQEVERNLDNFATPCFPDNWMHVKGKNEPFTLELECRLLMIIFKDTDSSTFGVISIKVDGKEVRTYDPKEIGWTHCNAIIAIREKQSAWHKVEIGMQEGEEDKYATILGFGFV